VDEAVRVVVTSAGADLAVGPDRAASVLVEVAARLFAVEPQAVMVRGPTMNAARTANRDARSTRR
jgi:hypothetical protein